MNSSGNSRYLAYVLFSFDGKHIRLISFALRHSRCDVEDNLSKNILSQFQRRLEIMVADKKTRSSDKEDEFLLQVLKPEPKSFKIQMSNIRDFPGFLQTSVGQVKRFILWKCFYRLFYSNLVVLEDPRH